MLGKHFDQLREAGMDKPRDATSPRIEAVLKWMAWGDDCREDAAQLLAVIDLAAPAPTFKRIGKLVVEGNYTGLFLDEQGINKPLGNHVLYIEATPSETVEPIPPREAVHGGRPMTLRECMEAEETPHKDDLDEIKQILQDACDRSWKDETLYQTANIASNAIYWRDREIAGLRKRLGEATPSATRPIVSVATMSPDCKVTAVRADDKNESASDRMKRASFDAKYAGFAAVPLNMALEEIERLEARLSATLPKEVEDALRAVVAWRDGPEGPQILFREGSRMIDKVRHALREYVGEKP